MKSCGNINEKLLFFDDGDKEHILHHQSYAEIYQQNDEIQRAKEYYEKALEAYYELNLQTRVEKIQNIINNLSS